MNYLETINYIEDIQNFNKNAGNQRMFEMMAALGNPQDSLRFIHVAGTNGKGSCSASIAEILKDAGYKVGLFISPHLIKYEERFSINGKLISKKDLIKVAEKVKAVTEKMVDQPTIFEKLTAMGFVYFQMKKCDVVVLEVGLGGRLDATNIIKNPDLCIIMNIGLEHIEVLGDTLEKIAYEKAGIIKENSDVVVYDNPKKVLKVFKNVSKEKHANLIQTDFKKIEIIKEGLKGQVFNYGDIKNIKLSLLGKHQFYNAAVVIEACLLLKKKYHITIKNIRNGLKNTTWDARLSVLCEKPLFILDGAHNPQCAQALKESLPTILGNKKAIFLCGMLKDKDYKSVMKMMIPFAKEFICLTPYSSRALSGQTLKETLTNMKQKAEVAESVEEGILKALNKASNDDVIIAFGSLYLAGFIKDKYNVVYRKWVKTSV